MHTPDWTCVSVTKAVESRGYQRVPADATTSALWYVSPTSTPTVAQYLVLVHKPRTKAYSVQFGFSCRAARDWILEIQSSFGTIASVPWPPRDRPCWTLFDAGRALHWGYLAIPDPIRSQAAPLQFRQLCEQILEPIVEPATSCEQVLTLLLRDDIPFEWGITNSLVRAAEVMAISLLLGQRVEISMARLLDYQSKLEFSLRSGVRWRNCLEELQRHLLRTADGRVSTGTPTTP